jgi:hypothetical protein
MKTKLLPIAAVLSLLSLSANANIVQNSDIVQSNFNDLSNWQLNGDAAVYTPN